MRPYLVTVSIAALVALASPLAHALPYPLSVTADRPFAELKKDGVIVCRRYTSAAQRCDVPPGDYVLHRFDTNWKGSETPVTVGELLPYSPPPAHKHAISTKECVDTTECRAVCPLETPAFGAPSRTFSGAKVAIGGNCQATSAAGSDSPVAAGGLAIGAGEDAAYHCETAAPADIIAEVSCIYPYLP